MNHSRRTKENITQILGFVNRITRSFLNVANEVSLGIKGSTIGKPNSHILEKEGSNYKIKTRDLMD